MQIGNNDINGNQKVSLWLICQIGGGGGCKSYKINYPFSTRNPFLLSLTQIVKKRDKFYIHYELWQIINYCKLVILVKCITNCSVEWSPLTYPCVLSGKRESILYLYCASCLQTTIFLILLYILYIVILYSKIKKSSDYFVKCVC